MHTNYIDFRVQVLLKNFAQAGSKYAQQFGVINERQSPITFTGLLYQHNYLI